MDILVARWGSANYPRNTDASPAWDTQIKDTHDWLNTSTGFIYLPEGDYHVDFAAIVQGNLSSVNNRIYGWLAVTPQGGSTKIDTRYREDRAAGVLMPKMVVSGTINVDVTAPDTYLELNTMFRYENNADVNVGFELTVFRLN